MPTYLPGLNENAYRLPINGKTGQALCKMSDTDFDADWVTVAAPGDEGDGSTGGAASAEVRCDTSSSTTIYVGRAPAGTPEASPGWRIIRTTFSALGSLQSSGAASGAWSNRANFSYS